MEERTGQKVQKRQHSGKKEEGKKDTANQMSRIYTKYAKHAKTIHTYT